MSGSGRIEPENKDEKDELRVEQRVISAVPRTATPYPLDGTEREFPDIEIQQEQLSRRRPSVPPLPDNPNVNIYNGRRHSEVILSPSDAFRRDYFKFPTNPFTKVNEYLSGAFQKFNKRFRSQDINAEFPSNRAGVKQKWKKDNMSEDEKYWKQYLNPLETSDNGNEAVTFHSDDFFEGDEEIGRPNSHSTPKHSPDGPVHDTLFVTSESAHSSRRNSEDVENREENAKTGHVLQNQGSVTSNKTVETILNPSSLRTSPVTVRGRRSPEKSILRNQSSSPNSPRRGRRRSVEFKMQSTHSDETLNRYSNHLQDGRQSIHGHYEENLRTVMSFHPHLPHSRWDHANVNGTNHPDRRMSRVSIHPAMATLPRDSFGPRLSTVVDEVMTNRSPTNDDDKDSLLKCSEIEYASGGLLSFNINNDEQATSTASRPPDTETLLFHDGRRRIDMVLVYEEEELGVMTEAETLRRERRKAFRENLEKEGLEFELEDKKASFDEKTFFLKIHAPWQVMTRYAELMNIKMPIKSLKPYLSAGEVVFVEDIEKATAQIHSNSKPVRLGDEKPKIPKETRKPIFGDFFEYDHTKIAEEPSFYKATFSRDREEQFVVKDRETFFTSAQRSQIVWQILMRVKYDETEKVGIRRLLNDETFVAAFPLHEGSYETDAPNGFLFDRRLLYLEWARAAKWYKKQPLWLIRKYFGDKIGLYFAWLGFYTYMLVLPAVVGVLCFFYGLLSLNSSDNIPSKEICDDKGAGNLTLCPMCDKACRYLKLGDSCMYAKITYLFDNPATVFFAVFMSFWATTFLELWKRQQSIIVWEWDLQFIEEDEEPRPEFETSVKTYRINPVTREKEPYLPTWSRALRFFATGATVLCMIVVVLGAVLGTIIYRISVVTAIYSGGGPYLRDHAKIFTSMTAALINLIIIMILTKFYHTLAIWLTNVENPRTQTEYEDSYTFKIFLFEFVNFYSSLIYIAFFKGRFFEHPGDTVARQSEFFKLKGDVCDPAGCLSELCIQLAIIMIGKQCLNNVLELLYPKFWNWWYHRIHHNNTKKDFKRNLTRWEEDYQMQDAGRLALFEEYLEMVLQYGFVTLFVAAFPLAPLFALLNNIGEIRLDAYKMVTQSRRPLAERVEDIGAWYGILKGLTYISVVSNAFVIAYTSDFIPRMVYKFVYSDTHDLTGYIKSSLSEFNTANYTKDMGSPADDPDPPVCYYRGYRKTFDDRDPYGLSPQYWHVFAARLAFVVVFEHIVFALTGVMAYVIPDIPSAVKTQMQRERLLAKEARYERGLKPPNNDDELLAAIRDQNQSKLDDILRRGSWGRRLSKHSDSLEAHVDVASKNRKMSNSTVWEVT